MKTFIAALLLAFAAAVQAQQYPVKPGRIVVTFPPGGGIDYMGRILAQKFQEQMGQPFVVDNRAGGNTIIGTENVARSAPDGYSLLLAIDFTFTMNPATYDKLPYDPVKDFAPVSQLGANKIALVGSMKSPASNLQELIAYARANPGKVNFGSAGLVTRLIGEQLKAITGTQMTYIPYKGSNAVLPAVLNGEIDIAIDGLSLYIQHINEGKLRAIAMAAPNRAAQMPQLATLREMGYAQAEMDSWLGLFAPGGTPRPIVQRLNAEVVKAWSDPAARDKLVTNGQDPVSSTPEALGQLVTSGIAKWTPVIKALGIRTD